MKKSEDAAERVSILYRHIIEADRGDARLLLAASAEGMGYDAALRHVLEPTLRMVGERWAADRISLAQGFVAGKVAEDFLSLGRELGMLRPRRDAASPGEPPARAPSGDAPSNSASPKGPARIAVLGNAEDDYHILGRSMVASFLEIEGWDVVDLGCDILSPDFVENAIEAGACVIGASAMMLTTARNIAGIREELDRRGLADSIKLAVGGAVFAMRPELVAEVGGDGTARTALEAPALFERLRSGIAPSAGEGRP